MFEKVLIANRGEIACRIISTLKKMGITSVAVYSDADCYARHTLLADEAYHIGGSRPDESYLKVNTILELAKRVGVDAIHPGYGFLSENSNFSRACAESGIIFIGPKAETIDSMGAKDAAKALMEAANVPVVPGYHGKNQDGNFLKEQAEKIGYPLLIKAVSGGGGKGMRVVTDAHSFLDSLDAVKRESLNAFSDDKVLLERYITKPRHIEFQVFGDTQGNYLHLHERECSLQRRHQKILEETPSPFLDDATREKMGTAAVNAVRAIEYEGAGTIEFIVSEDRSFYFMEMNTRLQVEHPVTEMITGQDLVEWQLRVAAGEALPLMQKEIPRNGHAIETRIYAENPYKQFLPSTGQLHRLRFPHKNNENCRIETGVSEGDLISIFYDPMIAKLVVWGEDREVARKHLLKALGETGILGVDNNIIFLSQLIQNRDFIDSNIDTQYIDGNLDKLLSGKQKDLPDEVLVAASAFVLIQQQQEANKMAEKTVEPQSPWFDSTGWRLTANCSRSIFFLNENSTVNNTENQSDEEKIEVNVTEFNNHFVFHSKDSLDQDVDIQVEVSHDELFRNDKLSLLFNKWWHHFYILSYRSDLIVSWENQWYSLSRFDQNVINVTDQQKESTIKAPMPGTVYKVFVSDGESVKEGQPLVIIEAMKMEHTLTALADGVIDQVRINEEDLVEADKVLITFVEEK